jgi:hypothetical protein
MAEARLSRVLSHMTASPVAAESKTSTYTLSTHVLNTATGYPGRGVTVDLDTKVITPLLLSFFTIIIIYIISSLSLSSSHQYVYR